jgi:8-oxo-dGTP diphosphatase
VRVPDRSVPDRSVPADQRAAMLLVVADDGRLLMHLRDDRPDVIHPGCWAGFGGAVEGDETVEEAVRREMLEETGVAVADPIFLIDSVDVEGSGKLVALFYVVGGITVDDIDLHEGAGVGLHTVDELADLRVSPFIRRAIHADLVPALARRAG